MEESRLRLSGVVKESVVDGPGIRYTVFTQGCPHHCPGCHNPETHPFDGGFLCEDGKILADLGRDPLLSGVTFSGGEPFAQAANMARLGRKIKAMGLNLMCYTGYTFEQLFASGDAGWLALLETCDLLVDGPFLQEQRDLSLLFRGSKNQRILDVPASLATGKAIEADLS
ncbi:MAG: anaerobic ribonucleoside-triphosphate reductase activating protein [Oscillospiraceae bacterium]|jgi:anaerobic ribonucleoside-triphosphate reductase activating protein|nr:anaerobic ribonucleoside-triphosphate reductase activating protein [Oscillospiraceae bacterium]